MKKYCIGPIEVEARTRTEAREKATVQAAEVLERLQHCPSPIPGPPGSEIVAISIIPTIHCSWEARFLLANRVFSHISCATALPLVKKQAVEFAAQYGLSKDTKGSDIEDLVEWAVEWYRHIEPGQLRAELAQIVLRAKAVEKLKKVKLASGENLSSNDIHRIVCGSPGLEGEFLMLWDKYIRSEGI